MTTASGAVGRAFVDFICPTYSAGHCCQTWHRYQDARRFCAAIGAVAGIVKAAHGLHVFENAAIGAGVFINGHKSSSSRSKPAHDNRAPGVALKIRRHWNIDRSVQIFCRAVRIGHHIPLEDVIGQPQRGAGVGNINHARDMALHRRRAEYGIGLCA